MSAESTEHAHIGKSAPSSPCEHANYYSILLFSFPSSRSISLSPPSFNPYIRFVYVGEVFAREKERKRHRPQLRPFVVLACYFNLALLPPFASRKKRLPRLPPLPVVIFFLRTTWNSIPTTSLDTLVQAHEVGVDVRIISTSQSFSQEEHFDTFDFLSTSSSLRLPSSDPRALPATRL